MDVGVLLVNEDNQIILCNEALAEFAGMRAADVSRLSLDKWVAQNATCFDPSSMCSDARP